MIESLSAVTQSGLSVNEDVWGAVDRAAWVMDGATGLLPERFLPGPSDAAWFVGEFDRDLRATTNWDAPAKRLIGGSVERVRSRAKASGFVDENPHAMPAASLAMARVIKSGVELVALGDCKILYSANDGRDVLSHGRSAVTALDRKIVRRMTDHQRLGRLSYDDIFERLKPEILRNRLSRNQDDGYWVLDMTRRPLRHLQSRVVGGRSPITIALMSDGFYRLVDTFHAYDDRSLFAALVDRGPADLLAELRDFENTDAECRAFPRIKRRDDATALLWEVTGL
jgi:hypothetical protein